MTPDDAVDMLSYTLMTTTWLAAMLILPGLLVGLIISIIQAATQITEQTLSFLPRLLITLLILALFSHKIVDVISHVFVQCFSAMTRIS